MWCEELNYNWDNSQESKTSVPRGITEQVECLSWQRDVLHYTQLLNLWRRPGVWGIQESLFPRGRSFLLRKGASHTNESYWAHKDGPFPLMVYYQRVDLTQEHWEKLGNNNIASSGEPQKGTTCMDRICIDQGTVTQQKSCDSGAKGRCDSCTRHLVKRDLEGNKKFTLEIRVPGCLPNLEEK